MNTEEHAFLKEYKRRAEAALEGRISRMVLFGSRARGDAEEDSDWDVAVFLRDEPKAADLAALADAAFDLIVDTQHFIQPVPLAERTTETDVLLRRHIQEEGVPI